jgi:hypothetical protein
MDDRRRIAANYAPAVIASLGYAPVRRRRPADRSTTLIGIELGHVIAAAFGM